MDKFAGNDDPAGEQGASPMRVRDLREYLLRYDPEAEVCMVHNECGTVPVARITLSGDCVFLLDDVDACRGRLGRTVCELRKGHRGAHQTDGGKLMWPNKDDPEPQGFFAHECPRGTVCPHCGSKP